MYFDLTDDQKMLRDQLAGLLADRLADTKLMKLYDADETFDAALWQELSEMGLAGILVPETKGGLGMDLLTLAVVAEELGYAAAPAPLVANALVAWLLAQSEGFDAEIEELVSGATIAAFAVADAAGWNAADWSMSGKTLSGEIGAVEWGARANLFVVGLAGGKLGLVRAASAGVEVNVLDTVDRTRPVSKVTFDGAEFVALDLPKGVVTRLLDALAVMYACDACGASHRVLKMAIDYAGVRKQFDKLIGQFQGLKYQLVNMATEVNPCRPLVWYAAHAWDAIPDDASRTASLTKAHVTEVAVRAARMAVECHGGIGYTWEYPLHVWLKRAMHDRVICGQPAAHRARAADLAGW